MTGAYAQSPVLSVKPKDSCCISFLLWRPASSKPLPSCHFCSIHFSADTPSPGNCVVVAAVVAVGMDTLNPCVTLCLCCLVAVDPLHLPPTPPSSHGSDSEGGQSPARSLPPSSPVQLQATAKVASRAASMLSNSPLLTAPHVSWAGFLLHHLSVCLFLFFHFLNYWFWQRFANFLLLFRWIHLWSKLPIR